MDSSDLEELFELSCEERYDYFLDTVLEEKEIWILVNKNSEFLKIYAEEDDFEYLPVWPSSELAARYTEGSTELSPKAITLPEFLRKWVPGLTKDRLEIGVFPSDDGTVWIASADELKKDIQDELSSM